jgi:hypothetical protein
MSQTVADNGPGELLSAQICATPSAQRARRGAIISLAVMMSLLERIAYHESGHAAAALTFGMPIIRVTIDADPPHCHRGRWRSKSDMALANIVTLCLCGPAADVGGIMAPANSDTPIAVPKGAGACPSNFRLSGAHCIENR